MQRLLGNLLTTLSLLLFLATTTLWVRSYFHLDGLILARRHNLASWLGGLHYFAYDTDAFGFGDTSFHSHPLHDNLKWDGAQYTASPGTRFAGFIIARGQTFDAGGFGSTPLPKYTAIRIPFYLPTSLFLILPAIHLRLFLRHRHRLSNNLCPTCGYDLRASPGACPECGAPAPSLS